MKQASKFLKMFAVGIIWTYQRTLSFDHGWLKFFYPFGFCRFYPTCSEYTKQAIVNFGLFKGILLGISRLGKCHPWSAPRVDLAPKLK